MKKVTNIQIQGIVFNIDEDAYHQLDDYLKDIKKHFEKHEDSNEIIPDIESRIAEKFGTEVIKDKHQTISLHDVNALITSMGTIKDLSESEEDEKIDPRIKSEDDGKSAPESVTRRLYRNPDDAIIAGVSSGLAAYFGIDPIIIRVLFVGLLFAGGWSILIYIILWIAMPEAKTPSQKLQMYGNAVTLASLQKARREGSDTMTPAERVMKPVAPVLASIGRFLRSVGKPLIRIMGALFSFKMSLAILGITIAALMLGLNLYQGYLDEPSKELLTVISGTPLAIMTLAGYTIALIPLLLLLMAGLSIALWKNIFKLPAVLTAVALWFVAIATFALMGFQYAPDLTTKAEEIETRLTSQRERTQITKTVDTLPFTKVHAEAGTRIIVQSASSSAVVIKGQPQDLDSVQVDTSGGTLRVKHNHNRNEHENKICFFGCGQERVEVAVSGPTIEEIKGSDNARITTGDGVLRTRNLNLILEDIARAELTLDVESLRTNLAGNGNAEIQGNIGRLSADIEDIADLYMDDAVTHEATISAQDNASTRLHVTDYLEAQSKGMGNVYYRGNPRTDISENEHGPGKVRNVGM